VSQKQHTSEQNTKVLNISLMVIFQGKTELCIFTSSLNKYIHGRVQTASDFSAGSSKVSNYLLTGWKTAKAEELKIDITSMTDVNKNKTRHVGKRELINSFKTQCECYVITLRCIIFIFLTIENQTFRHFRKTNIKK